MGIMEDLKKRFDSITSKLELNTSFESLSTDNVSGIDIASSNGHIEIEGPVKSLKVNGVLISLDSK